MGVTASVFAFDARIWTAAASVDAWSDAGYLDDELCVVSDAETWLCEIDTPLGANKAWNDNLAGDFAWDRAREHVEAAARAQFDVWFSHLFWDAEERGCGCGRAPRVVAEGERVYARALLEHIGELTRPLAPIEAALEFEFGGQSPRSTRFHPHWIYDYDNFCGLVGEWRRIIDRALHAGPSYELLIGVWV